MIQHYIAINEWHERSMFLIVHLVLMVTKVMSLPGMLYRLSGLRLNDGLDIKHSQVGWGLMLCLWPGPPWFN